MDKKILFAAFLIVKPTLLYAMTEMECLCFLGCEQQMIEATFSLVGDMPLERYTTVYVFDLNPSIEGAFNTSSVAFDNPERLEFDGFYCKTFNSYGYHFKICCYYIDPG